MASKYKVTAPDGSYEGTVGGARFVNGKYEGELSSGALSYFRRRGYKVEKAGSSGAAQKKQQ